jgi:lipopolysaccharide biosynthesis glycosyltransferase
VFRIVCAKWGNLYTEADVNLLYEKVKRNCSVDFAFECFDDLDDSWEHYKSKHYRASIQPTYRKEEIQNGYHRDDFGGIPHYRKITMFEADKKFNSNDTLLYLDLDTIIRGDLAYFFENLSNEKPYLVWNYWYEDNNGEEWKRQYYITRCPLFNSSVMVWKPGQNKPIYDFVLKHTDECFFTYPSMDTFMFHQFGPYSYESRRNHFQYFDQGIVTTQRALKENEKPGIINMLEGMSHEEKKKCL